MHTQKNLLITLGEWWEQRQERVPSSALGSSKLTQRQSFLRRLGQQLVPNLGSVLLVLVLLYTFPGIAAPSQSPSMASTVTIPYQGRLADTGGSPVTGMQNMEFRIYDVPTGGTPLWEELWTGGNAVSVSDGLFNVMLGSLNNGLASVIQTYDELYLGITVGTDSEMSPRVQLGSVPFSMQALTVPDDSITSVKIVDDAVGSSEIIAGGVTTDEIADGTIQSVDLSSNVVVSSALQALNVAIGSGNISPGQTIPLPIYPDGVQADRSQCHSMITSKMWEYGDSVYSDNHGIKKEWITVDQTGTAIGWREVIIADNGAVARLNFQHLKYLIICVR
jgi:hypothetical protein